MADRLTQLQDCLEQLATQFYASIRYISTHHPSSSLSGFPSAGGDNAGNGNNNEGGEGRVGEENHHHHHNPDANASTTDVNTNVNTNVNANMNNDAAPLQPPPPPGPDTPRTFLSAQHELAQDLLLKTRQIEFLIWSLPGVETSEKEQEARIRELEGELQGAEEERRRAVEEMEDWRERLEGVLGGVRR